MRKNILAVSIAAMIGGLGFAGAASAGIVIDDNAAATTLEVSPTGVGHILLVPYFSTQNGNVSLLNIVNTDTINGKAVKLRYRGAANSDDIYDITVFLSPGDMWSANVSQVDGVSKLTTNDNSCTLPAEKAAINVRFGTSRLAAAGSTVDNKAGTLEGYVEILNMADVEPGTDLFKAIKHVNGTAPCDTMPSQKENLVDEDDAFDRGYNYPTGGLMANWSIINLSKAGSFTGEATAVVAVDGTGASAAANIVFSPQEEDETVANADDLTADPLLVGATPILTPKNYDFPDLSTPYVADAALLPINQAHMLSHALATASVTNEYMTSPDVGFATDWTFSMPSRRYNVALDYKTGDAAYATGAQYFTTGNTKVVDGKICVNSKFEDLSYFNTEEGAKNLTVGGYVVSPKPVNAQATLAFCGETSVLAFNKSFADATVPTGVLGALIARQGLTTTKADTTSDFYTDGWMSLKTPGNGGRGLPVVGHAFVKALATSFSLGGIWKHRTDATVTAPTLIAP